MHLNNTRLLSIRYCVLVLQWFNIGHNKLHDGDAIQSNPWDCTERIRFGSSRLPTDDGHRLMQQRHGSRLL